MTSARRLLAINNYFYRRGGAESVFLDHIFLFQQSKGQMFDIDRLVATTCTNGLRLRQRGLGFFREFAQVHKMFTKSTISDRNYFHSPVFGLGGFFLLIVRKIIMAQKEPIFFVDRKVALRCRRRAKLRLGRGFRVTLPCEVTSQ